MRTKKPQQAPIAIVGLAGRFPGAADIDGLWSLLSERGFAIGPVPAERWDASRQLDPEKAVQAVGGFIEGVELFDPTFFGISPREAEDIDPQQRLMLEVSWTALEDAGVRPETLAGSRTGVYVGASWHDYEILRKERGLHPTQHSAVGNALDLIAARLSYFYGLKGPSLTVETGCSSGMVALHLAVQALAGGEIDAAFVGGVNLILAPDVSVGLTRFGGLSPNGRCSAFSDQADGFVRGEGVIALYIKTLERALADGDRIHAVIAGSAVNNDGGGDSLVTPSAAGQEDLLGQVYGQAGIDANDVVYIEAHGTGTKVGDPVETGAIGRVLAVKRDPSRGKLAIGSVKTNIGHLEATAGLAGLAKAVLAIRHREVPPSLHSGTLNPAIDFDGLGLEVVREPMKLPEGEGFYVGVNSFGWGGTNAHVILTPPPPRQADVAGEGEGTSVLLPLSAQSDAALRQRAGDLAALIGANPETLSDIAGTLAHRRGHFTRRVGFVAADATELVGRLDAFAAGADDAALPEPESARTPGRVAFVFPGQGSQWMMMGARLIEEAPVFSAKIAECAEALSAWVDWDLTEIVAGRAGDGWLERVDQVQPVLWAMSVALAAVWKANGVTPDVVVGHSQGEVAAATVAGILSLRDAARIVAMRSSIIGAKAGTGRMLAVDLSLEDARAALEGFEDTVSIAVNNGPSSCVFSGDTDSIETLKALLDADEVFNRFVRVDYASHSHHMDEFKEELLQSLTGLEPKAGEVELFSTVELRPMDGGEMDAAYWVRNLRNPVFFFDAMKTLFEAGVTHVIEISPHAALVPAMEQIAAFSAEPPRILSTMKRDRGARSDMLAAFARAYATGLAPFGALPRDAHVALPPYPWARQLYWAAKARPRGAAQSGLDIALLPSASERDGWEGALDIAVGDNPWLSDHKVHEAVVFPGAGMMALMLAAGRARFGEMPRRLRNTRFAADLTLGDDPRRAALLIRDDMTDGGSVSLRSLPEGATQWVEHATAIVEQHMPPVAAPHFPAHLREATPRDPEAFYADCATRGLHYGPAFQGVKELFVGEGQALGRVRLAEACRPSVRAHGLHPALWDGALQVSLALGAEGETVVPVAVRAVTFLIDPDQPVTELFVHVRRIDALSCDIMLFDIDERPFALVEGLRLEALALSDKADDGEERAHRLDFIAEPGTPTDTAPRRWQVHGAPPSDALRDMLGEAMADAGQPAEGVVFIAPAADAGLAAQKQALMSLTNLVRSSSADASAPRLAIVTTNAQAQLHGDVADPGAALFWGFARVLRREHPELETILIDIAPGAVDALVAELLAWPGDDQVVLGADGTRHVGRLVRGEAEPGEARPVAWTSPSQPFRLVAAQPGY